MSSKLLNKSMKELKEHGQWPSMLYMEKSNPTYFEWPEGPVNIWITPRIISNYNSKLMEDCDPIFKNTIIDYFNDKNSYHLAICSTIHSTIFRNASVIEILNIYDCDLGWFITFKEATEYLQDGYIIHKKSISSLLRDSKIDEIIS